MERSSTRKLTNRPKDRRTAFTLIELLIVVAIIAILAAIAVPNFLEAQTRAKVSRALADMRSVATAIESYRVDTNKYPLAAVEAPFAPGYAPANYQYTVYVQLTTPIAYITTFPLDAFQGDRSFGGGPTDPRDQYDYRRTRLAPSNTDATKATLQEAVAIGVPSNAPAPVDANMDSWLLYSPGPDKFQNINTRQTKDGQPAGGFGDPLGVWAYYDPTNGTISDGDVIRSSIGGKEAMSGR